MEIRRDIANKIIGVTIDGIEKTIREWAKHENCPVSASCIGRRLRAGRSPRYSVFAGPRELAVEKQVMSEVSNVISMRWVKKGSF